jgi:hypothetical protein
MDISEHAQLWIELVDALAPEDEVGPFDDVDDLPLAS